MKRETLIVAGLGTAQTVAWGSTYYLPAILAGPIAADLGLSTYHVFVAFSAALLVAAVVGPSAGRWIDLHGGRAILSTSSLIFASGLFILGLADNTLTLVTAWLIIGAGMGIGLYEAAFASLTAIYGLAARAPITGITLVAGFASTVAWPLTSALETAFDWRTACFVWAAIHLVLALPLNWFLIPDGNVYALTGTPQKPAPRGPVTPLLLLAFVFAVTWFTSTAMAAHLPRLLQEAGASQAAAVAAGALIGPAQVAARLLEFSVLRHVHPLLSARLASMAHPIGAGVLVTFGPAAGMLFAAVHGAGNGILTIAKGTLPLVLFGPAGYGLRQGILVAPARVAQAAAPFVFALLMERGTTAALSFSAGLGLAAFVALFFLRPTAYKDEHETSHPS